VVPVEKEMDQRPVLVVVIAATNGRLADVECGDLANTHLPEAGTREDHTRTLSLRPADSTDQ
jgi:hypothetical protein